MQIALIVLFESPVPESDLVGQEVLSRILAATTSNFEKQLIDVSANVHLSRLSSQSVPPVVWETKERHSARACTVLDPIATTRQRLLFCLHKFILLSILKVKHLCDIN